MVVLPNRQPFGVFQEVHFQNQIHQRKPHLLSQSKRPVSDSWFPRNDWFNDWIFMIIIKLFQKEFNRQFSQFHLINLPDLKRKRNQFFLSIISANVSQGKADHRTDHRTAKLDTKKWSDTFFSSICLITSPSDDRWQFWMECPTWSLQRKISSRNWTRKETKIKNESIEKEQNCTQNGRIVSQRKFIIWLI